MNKKRAKVFLDGEWEYLLDPKSTFTPKTLPKGIWQKMKVPSNWCFEGLTNYSGVVWFRRRFDLPQGMSLLKSKREYWLRFQGVDYYARVWLNGVFVGEHEGYFQPFEFRITHLLRSKRNELLVWVNSPREEPGAVWPERKRLIKGVFSHHDCRPGGWDLEHGQDMNTGGIWGHVELYTTYSVRVVKLHITPQLFADGTAAVLVDVGLENLSHNTAVEIEITLCPYNFNGETMHWTGEVSLPPGHSHFQRIFHLKKPSLWWTWDHGRPNLYKAIVTLRHRKKVLDTYSERFGIRELIVNKEHGWILNGKRFFPRGTNIIPTQWLATYKPELIKKDIELLRNANVNAVRVHAHVTHPDFYSACDEAGILVWQDFPLQWGYEESEDFHNRAARQIQEMIDLLYNHPCIGIWCCHNEPNTDNKYKLDRVLYLVARSTDPNRHVELCSDRCEHVYPGWYYGHWSMFAGTLETPLGAPFVNEFGAQALPNIESMKAMLPWEKLWPPDWRAWAYHNFQYEQTFHVAKIVMGNSLAEFVKNSQDYQYRLLKFAIERYRASGKMTGVFQFMFVDPWPAITWSVVDWLRRPKKGYRALQLGFQPVLVVLECEKERFLAGSKAQLVQAVIIVNDLHRDFSKAELHIWLENEEGKTFIEDKCLINVPSNRIVRCITPFMKNGGWYLPETVVPGHYVLRAKLIHEGTVISQNEREITVESPVFS